MISNKLSSLSLFGEGMLLHVSRPVRWDSDHVVIMDDELQEIAKELVRNDLLGKTHVGLDFFDATINRVAAWVIGTRNTQKALMKAMLEPTNVLKETELMGDFTTRLALTEELKDFPFADIWNYYCQENHVPIGLDWLTDVQEYESVFYQLVNCQQVKIVVVFHKINKREELLKMKKMNVLQAPFVEEMVKTTKNLYRLGWDERNGGNISYLLKEEEILPFLNPTQVLRKIPMKFDATKLAGKYFIVTGSGKYFKNVCDAPSENLGILRVSENGQELELLWGLEDEAVPTSELPSHFMSHIARLAVDPENRIVMHNHASHLLAMSFTHELDEKVFTRTLWQMCTECLVVFPDGVGIIPWLVPGTNEIAQQRLKK